MTSYTDSPNPRFPPLMPPDWDDEIVDALNAFPSGLKFVQTQWQANGEARGANTLGFLALYPALAKAFLTFNKHAAIDSTLGARDRELIILRISWLIRSEYELVQHIVLGRRAGLTDEEIDRVLAGPDTPGWSEEDALLLRTVDELHATARIDDTTWAQLSLRFNHREMMDIIFLLGCYLTLGLAINSFRIPVESCNEPLDPALRAQLE